MKGLDRETYFTGVVVEKTATGERPVPRASVTRWPVRQLYKTDDQGQFRNGTHRAPIRPFTPSTRTTHSPALPPCHQGQKR